MSPNYDTWKAHDPQDDEDYRRPQCLTPGCGNAVTFPDFESYCSGCLFKQGQQRKRAREQAQLVENKVRR